MRHTARSQRNDQDTQPRAKSQRDQSGRASKRRVCVCEGEGDENNKFSTVFSELRDCACILNADDDADNVESEMRRLTTTEKCCNMMTNYVFRCDVDRCDR